MVISTSPGSLGRNKISESLRTRLGDTCLFEKNVRKEEWDRNKGGTVVDKIMEEGVLSSCDALVKSLLFAMGIGCRRILLWMT